MKDKFSFGKKSRDSHSGGHNLTSLVDCFAIILIYLLMATSLGQVDLDVPKDMKLPTASMGQDLMQSTIVVFDKGEYKIGDKSFTMTQLAEEFKRRRDEMGKSTEPGQAAIVIQADEKSNYSQINPIVLAGLAAGFNEIQFAVLKDEEKM